MQALRRFFEHLETTDVILVNPCADIPLPRLGQRLPKAVLTQQEARALLDAPDTQTAVGIRDRAILEMFYSTGIRLEEMTRLTVHDVDHSNGFVRVNKGKFAKDRMTPLGRKACDYVREYLPKSSGSNGARTTGTNAPCGCPPNGPTARSKAKPSKSWSSSMAATPALKST